MEYQKILLLILITNFITYISIVWAKFGLQSSISDSFRCWSIKWFNPFTLFCWIMSFTLLPIMPNPFFFFASAGIAFVGAAFNLDSKSTEKVHNKAAIIMIIGSLLGVGFTFNAWWSVGIIISLSLFLKLFKVNHIIWWIEIIVFVGVIYELIKYFF